MGTAKNMFKGIIFTCVYLTTTMIIPYLTFSWVKELSVLGIPIVMSQLEFERIIFSIGCLTVKEVTVRMEGLSDSFKCVRD